MRQEVPDNRQPEGALVRGLARILPCPRTLLAGTATFFVCPKSLARFFLDVGRCPYSGWPPRASKLKSDGKQLRTSHPCHSGWGRS